MDDTTKKLHGTTDAMVWAEEWCRIAREIEAADDGRQIIDEGWMVGWFANAIEIGRNAARPEPDTSPALVEALTKLGDDYGPLGVALAAARLTDPNVLVGRLS